MSMQIDTIKTRAANKKAQKMPLNYKHITTTDFFKPQILWCEELVPGDKFKVNNKVMLRGKPMALPTDGKFNQNIRAFFVPQRTISKDWYSFITGAPYTQNGTYGIHTEDIYITNLDLILVLIAKDMGLAKPSGQNDPVDIILNVVTTDDDIFYQNKYEYYLTDNGRIVYSLLQQLGYEINYVWYATAADQTWFDANYNNILLGEGNNLVDLREEKFNIKPLMAYAKIIFDWYIPTQYQNMYEAYFKEWVENEHFDIQNFDRILGLLTFTYYGIDYFTGAWQSPTGPNGDNNQITIEDITNTNNTSIQARITSGEDYYEAPQMSSNSGRTASKNYSVTDYALRALNAVQNWVTRNRIAGYRPVDRFLAHFGVHLDYKLTNRSSYITGTETPIFVSDVTALAESGNNSAAATPQYDQQQLGGIAGKLNGIGGIQFGWECDEHGYLFIIQTIVPEIGYVEGVKRMCMRLDRFDYYTAEYDNLGVQAIARKELFHAQNGDIVQVESGEDPFPYKPTQIWGYGTQYLAYKTGHDTLSGDHRVRSLNTGLDALHLFRMFKEDGEVQQSISSKFLYGDNEQYDRIFTYMSGDVDHIYVDSYTQVIADRDMQSASEAMPVNDGEGKIIDFKNGGNFMS